MHLVDRLAALCMGGGAWVGARCWLGGRGHGNKSENSQKSILTSFQLLKAPESWDLGLKNPTPYYCWSKNTSEKLALW